MSKASLAAAIAMASMGAELTNVSFLSRGNKPHVFGQMYRPNQKKRRQVDRQVPQRRK